MNSTTGRDTSADQKHSDDPRIDSEMLKAVIRQHWQDKLDSVDKIRGRALSAMIDMHLSNINGTVDPLNYETYCIPNIISHSKHMSKDEFGRYLGLLESMAFGYSSMFGSVVADLALMGLSSKARSVSGVERYHKLLFEHVESRISNYHSKIEKRKKHVDGLYLKVRTHERSLFRFFRRGTITRLVKRMDYGIGRVEALSHRFDRLNTVYKKLSVGGKKN